MRWSRPTSGRPRRKASTFIPWRRRSADQAPPQVVSPHSQREEASEVALRLQAKISSPLQIVPDGRAFRIFLAPEAHESEAYSDKNTPRLYRGGLDHLAHFHQGDRVPQARRDGAGPDRLGYRGGSKGRADIFRVGRDDGGIRQCADPSSSARLSTQASLSGWPRGEGRRTSVPDR